MCTGLVEMKVWMRGAFALRRASPALSMSVSVERASVQIDMSFAMAAIWDNWMSADGSEIETCAVVTTDANATLAPIHHRMPVIIDPEDFDLWLDPATPLKELERLMAPAPDDLLEAIPVSASVNRVSNDDPSLIDPALVTVAAPEPKKKAKTPDDRQSDLF